jgi:hypothetical protein
MASTKATIEITFVRDVADGEYITFERSSPDWDTDITITSTFLASGRRVNKELPIEVPTATPGESAAMTYERYFGKDHNASGLMTISRVVNVITIEINEPWDFINFSTTTGSTDSKLPYVPETFTLDNASLQINPINPCDIVDIEILTSLMADSYSIQNPSSISQEASIPVSTNPFTVSIDRLIGKELFVHRSGVTLNVSELEWNEPHLYFNKIGQENIIINTVVDPFSGGTITVTVDYLNQLTPRPNVNTLQYSLDNVNFFPSGVWSGQLGGDYTVYVKDSFGCTVSKDFKVADSIESSNPFFEISERNSVSFSKNEVWDGLQEGIHKNYDNVLALTDISDFNYDERVIFRDSDKIRIQFKSNYTNHTIHLEDCEGGNISYTPSVEKMSNNLGLYESLDCVLHRLPNGRSGLFFDSGEYYNEYEVALGQYELFGNLPDSATIGNFVEIVGYGNHEIVDIIYDNSLDKRLMVFNLEYTGVDLPVIMKCHYNLLPFDVYEFDVDFSQPIIKPTEKAVRIRIQAFDNLYEELNYYSEYCLLLNDDEYDYKKYVAIDYYGTNNRKVFYLYGLRHFLRAEIEGVNAIIEDSNEIVKGDSSTYVSESVVNKGMSISFSEVTYRVMLKIVLALSSENLFVNGLGYVKKEGVSVEPIANTNLYKVSCELLSTNKNFNTSISDSTGVDEGYKTIYVPNILGTSMGSVKL